jgi:predicted exporter
MPSRFQRTERPRSTAIGRAARGLATTLDASTKARWSALALFAVLAYLAIGRVVRPGFTDYWWYQLIQTSAILAVLLTLETVFARQGGLAWQTHLIIVVTTYADVLGTVGGLYDTFDPYDKIVHFWSGAAFAAVVYEVLRLLDRRGRIAIPPRARALLAVIASFAVAGLAWELYEYSSDAIFNSGRVQSRLDTTHDLISNAGGGLLAVVVLGAREAARARFGRRLTT